MRNMLASILEILPFALQILGGLFGGGKSSEETSKSALQDEVTGEYLQDYREMRPYRRYLGGELSKRAGKRPFYSSTWGRYGGDLPGPFVPPTPPAPPGS
jgi:hypothetical protein